MRKYFPPGGDPPLTRHPAEKGVGIGDTPAGAESPPARREEEPTRKEDGHAIETTGTATVGREAEAERVEAGSNSTVAQGWRELRALWRRGWASDDAPKAVAIARQAFERACESAEPSEIIEAAKIWVGAADASRYLPPLPQWLAARGWETPPPTNPKRARANGRKAQRSNGYAKPDMFKITLEAGGFREDADGKMVWPGDDGGGGAGDDDDAPLATSMWGGGQ